MRAVDLELVVEIGRAPVSYERLLNLGEGDVLLLDSDEGSQLSVNVQGNAKFLGRPTVSGGNLALTVDTVVDNAEDDLSKAQNGLIGALVPHSQKH